MSQPTHNPLLLPCAALICSGTTQARRLLSSSLHIQLPLIGLCAERPLSCLQAKEMEGFILLSFFFLGCLLNQKKNMFIRPLINDPAAAHDSIQQKVIVGIIGHFIYY